MLISGLFLPAPFSPAHDFLQAHKGEAEDPNPGQALVGFSERLGVILGKLGLPEVNFVLPKMDVGDNLTLDHVGQLLRDFIPFADAEVVSLVEAPRPVVDGNNNTASLVLHGIDAAMQPGAHIVDIPGVQDVLVAFQGADSFDVPYLFKGIQIRLVCACLSPKIQFLVILAQDADQVGIPVAVLLWRISAEAENNSACLGGGNLLAEFRRHFP